MKRKIITADHHEVHRHLATEELLLNTLPEATTVLYLWRADDSVVIGKNQNPWLECNLPAMAEAGCRLARRISGGGAVYHDLGNLNYAFFTHKDHYDKTALAEIVMTGVRSLGISCELGPRHLLQADGKKFSGNAFCIRRGKVLHHGTLLVDADLARLNRLLAPTCAGIEAKGIRSVPSEVINLRKLAPTLTVDQLKSAIEEAFEPTEPSEPALFDDLDDRTEYFSSDAWLYHRTPKFSATGRLTALPGAPEFRATIASGTVKAFDVDGYPNAGRDYVDLDFRHIVGNADGITLE